MTRSELTLTPEQRERNAIRLLAEMVIEYRKRQAQAALAEKAQTEQAAIAAQTTA